MIQILQGLTVKCMNILLFTSLNLRNNSLVFLKETCLEVQEKLVKSKDKVLRHLKFDAVLKINAVFHRSLDLCGFIWSLVFSLSEFELNEFKSRLKSAKNRFQLSTGVTLETLNTILSGTNHI